MTAEVAQVRPTMAMLTCLRRLRDTGGRLVRDTPKTMSGFPIKDAKLGWKVHVPFKPSIYWFTTMTGNGLFALGLVDELGYIGILGRAALENNK